jgi:hypothetical protein
VYFRSDSTAATITNETTIKIVLIMLTLAECEGHVIHVKCEFLKGRFNNGEEFYKGALLKLQCTIYGLKQTAYFLS